MATTAQRLIVNVETGSLLPSFEAVVGTTQPRYVVGDNTPVEIYLVKSVGALAGVAQVPFPGGSTVRLAVGVVNQQPTAGSWSLEWNGDTATGLAYNITPAALQTALNALASITAAGGVTVAAVGNHYQITFNSNGARVDFTAGDDTLTPASQVGIVTLQQGGASQKEIVLVNLAVSPVALTTSFTDVAAPSGSYSAEAWSLAGGVRGGGYKLQLTFTQNAVTKTVWTDTIGVGVSLQDISQLIFNALVNAGWGSVTGNATTNAWGLRVSALDTFSWRVDYTQPNFTTPIGQTGPTIIGIDVTGVTALAGKQADLGLATAEAVAYLGSESSKRAVLEIEVEAGGDIQTVIQTPCELLGQVIVSGALAPLVGDTPLGETVANNRFVRRDVAQSPVAADLDIIWPNLGVSLDGSDVADAISGAVAPAAGNVFVTMSERNPFDQTLNTGDSPIFTSVATAGGINIGSDITFADTTVQTTAYPGFDQSLNTTDAVVFGQLRVNGETSTSTFKVADLSNDYLTINAAGVLNSLESAAFGGTGVSTSDPGTFSITGGAPDTILSFSSLTFQGTQVLNGSTLSLTDGVNTLSVDAAAGITYADATTQNTAAVFFDQSLNTTNDVYFNKVFCESGMDSTKVETTGFTTTDGAATMSVTPTGITYADATVQTSAPVVSTGTVIHSGGGGHIDALDYPDEIRIVIGGVTYAMPARII